MKVEGRNAVEEALKSKNSIDKVLVQNGMRDEPSRKVLNRIRELGVKVQFADKCVLDKESVTHKHQGFIAYITEYVYCEIDDILESKGENGSFIVVLDGIEDPHNLGSIIRGCECAGVDGIIIGKHRSASVNETVMRISEGAANHVKIAKVTNINTAVEYLQKNGVWVYALEVGGDDIYKTNLKGNIAIVVGGEDTGVSRLTKEKCDVTMAIPMFGNVNSLNASVATGVAVYEAVRQRR